MWLNNYYNWMYAQELMTLGRVNTQYSLANTYKNTSGTVISVVTGTREDTMNYCTNQTELLKAFCAVVPALSYNGISTTNRNIGLCVVLGSGTTPVNLDDYKLKSIISSGLALSRSMTYTDTTITQHNYFTNSTGSNITVSEIGLSTTNTLLYRDVLEAPVTLAPNETLDVQYTIDCSSGAVSLSV